MPIDTERSNPSCEVALLMTSRQDSPLLALPGELRNRIYDFCAEIGPIIKIRVASPYVSTNEYRRLTQVYQQLRIEFRTRYMMATTLQLDSPFCFSHYAAVFYPTQEAPATKEYRGNFVFDVSYAYELEIDISPILKLLTFAPHIKCNFEISAWRDSGKAAWLAQLIDLCRHTAEHHDEIWHAFLTTGTRWLELRVQVSLPALFFYTSKKFAFEAEKWFAAAKLPQLTCLNREFRWNSEEYGGVVKFYTSEDAWKSLS